MKKILSVLLALVMIVGMIPMSILTASAADTTVVFELGTDGSASHADGNKTATSYSATVDGYKLTISNATNMYTDARDAKGNGCFKLGSSKNAGGFTITVPEDVTKVIIYIAQYKSNTSKITVNSTSYTLAKASNNGAYDAIEVDTSTTKTVTLTTVSGGLRAMVNSIEFRISGGETDEPECVHANTTNVAEVPATCTTAGYTAGTFCNVCERYIDGHEVIEALGHSYSDWVIDPAATCTEAGQQSKTCANCGDVQTEVIAATGHSYADGVCANCSAEAPDAIASLITTANEFVSGEYILVVSSGYAMGAYDADSKWVLPVKPTLSGDEIVEATGCIWTLTVDGGSVVITDANDKAIKPTGGNNNGIANGAYNWAWSINEDGTFVFAGVGDDTVKLASNTTANSGDNKFRAYKAATVEGNTKTYLANFSLYKVGEGEEVEPEDPETPACEHTDVTTETLEPTCEEDGYEKTICTDCGEVLDTEVMGATGHSFENGTCSECGAADPNAGADESVKIVFGLGNNGTATHNDGKAATTYTETVDDYTLSITDGTSMYTGAYDAKGNSCIKIGTSKVVGGFSFTAPDDVTEVVISIAKYKANSTTVSVNGTSYTLTKSSNDGAYDEITVDTSSNKTITVTTVGTTYRAMVNSITYICAETDHTCVWGEGVVTTPATCTTDGVMTYTCTVDGCIKTEAIAATGHTYTHVDGTMTCSCGDSQIISTIAEAKAASGNGKIYYIKGIVTYVNGKEIYMEDTTGGILIYGTAAFEGINLGDELVVWDDITTYQGKIETNNTAADQCVVISTDNSLPATTVTIDQITADSFGKRVVIENVTMGVMGTNNTALTDTNGNSINIYKLATLPENINENDTVTVTAIVSAYNTTMQLLVNPGTAAADVVETTAGEEEVVETVTIAEAKAGAAGEYYQVEGVVTFIDGRNVYIQDATGGIVVYLTANAATTKVGDTVKAYGALKIYNGLIELDAVDEANAQFYSILSSGNIVEAQEVTIAGLLADTTNEYLAEKVSVKGLKITKVGTYSADYKNVDYTVTDGTNSFVLYRTPAASADKVLKVGDVINVVGVVTTYNGYQLRVVAESDIVVVPSIELTHITLDPNNDALGFKAAATNAPEGAQVEISLWVDGGNTVTRTANKANISLRLNNIMANNGGETTIYAKVVLKDAEGNVIAESQVAETSMKDAIIAVNGMTLTSDQQTAVGKLYAAYESVMSAWFAEGETNNIASWKPTEA